MYSGCLCCERDRRRSPLLQIPFEDPATPRIKPGIMTGWGPQRLRCEGEEGGGERGMVCVCCPGVVQCDTHRLCKQLCCTTARRFRIPYSMIRVMMQMSVSVKTPPDLTSSVEFYEHFCCSRDFPKHEKISFDLAEKVTHRPQRRRTYLYTDTNIHSVFNYTAAEQTAWTLTLKNFIRGLTYQKVKVGECGDLLVPCHKPVARAVHLRFRPWTIAHVDLVVHLCAHNVLFPSSFLEMT